MQINQITFTNREIDVISCVLNSRGVKKIADILSISPRTVETHLQNIYKKIGGNSQENIIDFVEKSEQLKPIKEHYLNLLIMTVFERQLKQLSFLTRKRKFFCSIVCTIEEAKEPTLQRIAKHLKLAGLEIELSNKDNNKISSLGNTDNRHNIYLLSKENIDSLLVEESFEVKRKDLFLVKDSATQILISKRQLELSVKDHIINLSTEEQYFQNVFYIINELAPGIDLNKFIDGFQKLRASILGSKGNSKLIESLYESHNTAGQSDQNNDSPLSYTIFKCHYVKILASFLCLLLLSGIVYSLQVNSYKNTKPEIQDFFLLIKNMEFSADNVTKEQAQKNHSLVKQIEKYLNDTHKQEIRAYFNKPEIPSEELTIYLYNLHALANYYMYHEYGSVKAQNILFYSKKLAEDYITTRSKIKLDFEQLSKEATYAELSIIKDLPEIYTRIIYALARSYFYQNNALKSIKYFELSRYLGERLNLFEGYLSYISGLGVLKLDKVTHIIDKGDSDLAQQELHKLLQLYKQLKDSSIEYKIDYKPGLIPPKTIIPKDHKYNQVECSRKIIEIYAKLILIASSRNKKIEHLNSMLEQLTGTTKSIGILLLIESLPNKKVASVYNTLGNIILQLFKEPINLSIITIPITKKLGIANTDALAVTEQLFKSTESYSRSTEYTKADAYEGLARVYQMRINSASITQDEKSKLQKLILDMHQRAEAINKELNRKVTTLAPQQSINPNKDQPQ